MLGPWLPLLTAVALASLATPAAAQETEPESHLALAQPSVPETLPASALRQIVVRIAEGLVESGLDVSVDPFPPGSCVDAACLRDMARAHGAAAVVLTRITAEGQNFRVHMDLVDGTTGQPVVGAERSCNFCAYDELGPTAVEATRALLRLQRERQRAMTQPLRLVRRREVKRPTRAAWAAVGLGIAATAAGAVLLAAESDEPDARLPAMLSIAAGTALVGGGGAVLLFWPQTDARGRVVGAASAVRVTF